MLFEAINDFQGELFSLLVQDDLVKATIGDAIFDGAPLNWSERQIYIQIGEGQMRDIGAQSFEAREWQFQIGIFAEQSAFHQLMPLANHIQRRVLQHKFSSSNWLQTRFGRMVTSRLDQDQVKRSILHFKVKFQQMEEV